VGLRFSPPVQTGLGAHPASYTRGTRCFSRAKLQGLGIDHPPQSSTEFKERAELYSPLGLHGLFQDELFFFVMLECVL